MSKCVESPAEPGFRRACCQAGFLLLIAAVLAALTGWSHPRSPYRQANVAPGIPSISVAEARALHHANRVLWVDARSAAAFATGHIAGSISLTEKDWENQLGEFVARWSPDRQVIVYCDSSECDASLGVALRLVRELQIGRVHILEGGWQRWQESVR